MAQKIELTPREWKALAFIYKNLKVSKEKLAIHLFGTSGRGAAETAENTADRLWDFGLVINLGDFEQYRYTTTEAGEEFYENHPKPLRDPRFTSR